jgi:hypothetical protein
MAAIGQHRARELFVNGYGLFCLMIVDLMTYTYIDGPLSENEEDEMDDQLAVKMTTKFLLSPTTETGKQNKNVLHV